MKQPLFFRKLVSLAFSSALLFTSLAVRADLDSGLAAYEAGNFATALSELQPLADNGNAEAQFTLSWMYRAGSGVPADMREAQRLLRLAADQGHGQAQIELSTFLFYGLGSPPDIPEGVRLLELAVAQGIPEAQEKLGTIYNVGSYVKRNLELGTRLLEMAAEQDYAPALYNLGQLHYYGDGDYIAAESMFRRAALMGHADSMFFLGIMYYQGQWLMQDTTKAYMWLHLALNHGSNSASMARTQLEEEMDSFDVEDAKRMAQACEAKNLQNC